MNKDRGGQFLDFIGGGGTAVIRGNIELMGGSPTVPLNREKPVK